MEQEERKKILKKKLYYSLLYFLLFATASVLIAIRSREVIKPVWALNIGINLFSMPIGFLLGIFTLEDSRKKGGYQVYFRPMLTITSFGLLANIIKILVNEDPALIKVNIAANTAYLLCYVAGCYVMWRFVTSIILLNRKYEKILDAVMRCGAVVFGASIIFNVFFGYYYSIDGNGHYVRGPLFFLISLYLLMTICFTTILILNNRKRLKISQMISFYPYFAGPMIFSLFLMRLNVDISISFGIAMFNMLIIYCTFNIEEYRARVLAEKDIKLAASIQQSVLPRKFPPFPERKEFALHAAMYPAKTVGGDFYDFFLIDDDHLCMIIGDVSGKGVPASLFMMSSRTILHGRAGGGSAPEIIMRDSNEEIVNSNPETLFVTVWIGILEISIGILRTSNAGHEYPALRHEGGKFDLFNDEHGVPVGLMDGVDFPSEEIQMAPGDCIFVYTDGVPEATNGEDIQFGNNRMLEALNTDPDASPEQCLDHIKSAVDAFVKQAEQFDDLTMLCLKYLGNTSLKTEG